MNNTVSPQAQQPRSSKKGLAIGLTAGLVGGSLAGLVLGVPGLSSAADDDDTSPAAPAALVQQVDDTVGEGTQTNPGERLRDALQPLVVDGTLTASQADSVATHLVENRPERGDRGDRGNHGRRGPGKFARSEVLTELLGVGADELREELRAGSTLAEIAAANGVETSAVIAALVTQAEERINTAVEAERITAEEVAEKLAKIETRITDKINGN
ncbi:hypothetical protein [uncultured Ilumatobacter sp.]|uniref:hypothetical protein n=1 Tax=uncultured Ilumatobacter sp. TaxID=879968 RepID=UPI00374EFAE2